MSSPYHRTKAAQSASAPSPCLTNRTLSFNSPHQTPTSLTPSLQRIPAGQSPLQYYASKRQAFEEVQLGLQTQRKDMNAHLRTVMRNFESAGAGR